ncbi:MAG: MarR family winged helix-turn-helix transcriptional regulator [Acidimicrobiales bacterium]
MRSQAAGVDWLDEAEQRAWHALILLAQLLPGYLDRQLQGDSGLAHYDYAVLATLSDAPVHRLRMSDLAALMDFSPSRLSHAMSRLEKADWVRRVPCPSDKRVQYAELTDLGQSVLTEAAPGHVAHVRTLVFDHLTASEVRQLGIIAEHILQQLVPRGTCSPGASSSGAED